MGKRIVFTALALVTAVTGLTVYHAPTLSSNLEQAKADRSANCVLYRDRYSRARLEWIDAYIRMTWAQQEVERELQAIDRWEGESLYDYRGFRTRGMMPVKISGSMDPTLLTSVWNAEWFHDMELLLINSIATSHSALFSPALIKK